MSTDRETTRVVRSWLEEGVTALPDRVLDAVLDQVPTTPQRRSWWPSRRFFDLNSYARIAIGAAAVVLVAVIGYSLIPGRGGIGGQPTAVPTVAPTAATPSSSPAPLALGDFTSHGVTAQIDARGTGADVTGTMTLSADGDSATVAFECSRTEVGLIMIGGLVTDSTFDDNFPQDRRVAIILEQGSPVKAVWWIALVAEAPVDTCQALVEMIDPEEATAGLEPIVGTLQLRP